MSPQWSERRCEILRASIKKSLEAAEALTAEFSEEKRRFTLDGHLIGSIGEVVAAYAFNLQLLPSSAEGHDAEWLAEDQIARSEHDEHRIAVQIKLTGGTTGVSFYSVPKHLIVLQLINREFKLVYNGPGPSDDRAKRKNGQFKISLNQLRRLDKAACPKLKQVYEFPSLV